MRYTWMLPCAVLGGVLMAACQVLIYRYAPVEQTMGLVQKIFYTHLPLAWWSFVSFFLVCVSGVEMCIRDSVKARGADPCGQ